MCINEEMTKAMSGEAGMPPLHTLLRTAWKTPFEMKVEIFDGKSLKTLVTS
jgi:hypothetical protein